MDADELAKFHTLEAALAGDRADEDRQRAVAEMARAQFELLRVRKIRAAMLAAADLEGGDPKALQRLLALDRYERYAHTKRRRAWEG
jgi:uncharacterized protein (UPF0261 family)